MAISVNTVYQRVLGVLNKEQRGYVTAQEFNLFANQAQQDLFEQYFYDINQFGRVPGNSTEYSDMVTLLNEKINIFETIDAPTRVGNYFIAPSNLYRLGSIVYKNTTTNSFGVASTEQIEAERINANEFLYINSSPLTKPTNTRPVFISNTSGIKVYANSEVTDVALVDYQYIKKPATVNWAYQIVFNEPLYDASNSVDFELHPADEADLVIKILELAGILIKDLNLYQVMNQEEQETIQQEKA
ncbi:MAG: hypothetical protein CMJ25_33020 [Phycisphaerae bacterium]|nr:hypothetical protein [Phycisphaerae bacterium]|tara:strand:+ start:173 stop:904 length:732 start_codon:yes stop_codon:yes gene_type:complete